jgi:putative tryptophan/tyrosine transport system substrate-binding protein
MKRREVITLIGAALGWPLAARAQQAKVVTIGVLIPANPEPFWSVLREALREFGYIEGQNVRFEFRSADGNPSLLSDLATELVRLRVDIIVASQTPAVHAAKQATSEIPIVMASAGDPVGTGLVASLARPGGNITGNSGTTAELGAKTLELVREMLPATHHVAVLANAADPFTTSFLKQIEAGGQAVGLRIQSITVRGAEEFEAAFAAMTKERADAVVIQPSLPRKRALDLALRHRLPSVSPTRLFPSKGD